MTLLCKVSKGFIKAFKATAFAVNFFEIHSVYLVEVLKSSLILNSFAFLFLLDNIINKQTENGNRNEIYCGGMDHKTESLIC